MNIEVNKEYDNYFEMFGTKGYKQLVQLMEERLEVLKSLMMQAKDLRDLGDIQGQFKAYTLLIHLEEGIRQEHDALLGDTK